MNQKRIQKVQKPLKNNTVRPVVRDFGQRWSWGGSIFSANDDSATCAFGNIAGLVLNSIGKAFKNLCIRI